MNLLRKFLIAVAVGCVSTVSLAETGSVVAKVELIPASTITSAPMGSVNDPIENLMDYQSLLTGGAWTNSAVGPTMYQKGIFYYLNLLPVGSVPATATITSVVYSWGLSYKPAGLITYLCHNTTSACLNVTSVQSSSTTAFNGLAANKKMIFAFGVSGSGSLTPTVYGQTDQVIVNYQY